jgi:Na+-driven multidrug efflux pump
MGTRCRNDLFWRPWIDFVTARELFDAMVIAFLGYFGLAIVLGHVMGNNSFWRAFCCFMILRGSLLAARLPRIERANFAMQSASKVA